MNTPENPALIIAENLSKAFGLRFVLRGISFSVMRGECVALLGPNGSGKTTLLRILAALSTPSGGTLTLGGWRLPREASMIRAHVGVISHQPLLYDDLTATENLHFYGKLYGLPGGAALQERATAALLRVGLEKRANDLTRTFSRGMAQRLALARAMLHEPPVLLLDEPYTGLDAFGEALIDDLLREWKTAGRTVIASLHDLSRAAALCDRALILRAGRLAADINLTESGAAQDLRATFVKLTG